MVDQLRWDPFDVEIDANPYETWRRLRDDAPVYRNEELDFYALTRYEDVAAAYRNFQTYSSARGLDLTMVTSGEDPPKMILFMDPPDHGRMRGLLNKAFTARAIRSPTTPRGSLPKRRRRSGPGRTRFPADASR